MSCCGNKRAQWLRETRNAVPPDSAVPARPAPPEAPGLFRYTGSGRLTVEGVHSGAVYRFTYPGQTLEVAYADTFALRAEPDLQFVRRATVQGEV